MPPNITVNKATQNKTRFGDWRKENRRSGDGNWSIKTSFFKYVNINCITILRGLKNN